MLSIRIASRTDEIPVHLDWTDTLLPGVHDPLLRAAILEAERNATRLTATLRDSLVTYRDESNDTSAAATEVDRLVLAWGPGLFKRLGILWNAPYLAPSFLNARSSTDIRGWKRADLKLILRFRDRQLADGEHFDPDHRRGGMLCLTSWLLGDVGHELTDLIFTLPQLPLETTDVVSARRVLIRRALEEPDALAEIDSNDY